MIAKNSKFKKIYNFEGRTPYSFPITIPSYYKSKLSLWLDPYNETKVVRDSNNYVSEIDSSSIRADVFSSVTGSGLNPFYTYKNLNSKSYLSFSSGEYLSYSGISGARLVQDFRNFTFFAVYKPTNSVHDCNLLKFYNSDTGVANGLIQASFGRDGSTNNLAFNYTNQTGALPTFSLANSFDTNWNIGTIIYDGAIVSGRKNTNPVGSQAMVIDNSGWFDRIEVGSNNYHGSIAEILLFPYKLQSNEIVEVEAYLKYKWSL